MKILHISHTDQHGGAARAAYRLHCALRHHGQSSQMIVQKKTTNNSSVIAYTSSFEKVTRFIGKQLVRLQHSDNTAFHTVSWLPFRNHRLLQLLNTADIVHLHWFRVSPSIPTIASIQKPVIWTLHDMWAFCGAEHITSDHSEARWRTGYSPKNRSKNDSGLDINRWAWNHKKKYLKKNQYQIVAPSRWLATCARESSLLHMYPTHIIPNLLNITTHKPLNKSHARLSLNLPQKVTLILFGAIGGGADPNKGFNLLLEALKKMSLSKQEEYHFVVFGQEKPDSPPDIGRPTHWMGHIQSEETSALLYNAVDVMVVPSYQEAFGQTASEAQACGCPVVAFKTTGLSDVVMHKKTGYLAQAFEPEDLANGIKWILKDKERYYKLSNSARERAVKLWSTDVVVPQYLDVYRQTIEQHQLKNRIRS